MILSRAEPQSRKSFSLRVFWLRMIGGELERATLGRFFVPLASPKVLAFDNKNKKTSCFILYCAHFFVPLPLNRDEGLLQRIFRF